MYKDFYILITILRVDLIFRNPIAFFNQNSLILSKDKLIGALTITLPVLSMQTANVFLLLFIN